MNNPVDAILSLVLLSILFSFGSSRLPGLIKVLAFQGVVVSIVPLFIGHDMTGGGILFTMVTLIIRGIVIPLCIYLAIKKVAIHREVEPIVGYHASMLAGLGLIVAATCCQPQVQCPLHQCQCAVAAHRNHGSGGRDVPADGTEKCHCHGPWLYHDGKRHLPGGNNILRSGPPYR